MESWKPGVAANYNNHKASGRSRPNAPCKKHPRHRQSPGVCSICLSEKLSQLSNSNNTGSSSSSAKVAAGSSSSSSLSSYVSSLSSSNASSCSSPVVSYTCGVESEARKSMRVFKKSRSMAFVPRRRREEDENGKIKIGGIKGGFWSKILPRRSRGLMHSMTMRERAITAVH